MTDSIAETVLQERGLVYGSGRALMGFHAGMQRPVQIGKRYSGIIVSLAYVDGKLYHVEHAKPILANDFHKHFNELHRLREDGFFAREFAKIRLVDSLKKYKSWIRIGVEDITNFNGKLIGVTSNLQEPQDVLIIDPFSGKQLKKIRGIRDLESYTHSNVQIASSGDTIYVKGHHGAVAYNTATRRSNRIGSDLSIIAGTSLYSPDSLLAASHSGLGSVFHVSNVTGFPTPDHVSLGEYDENAPHFVWSLLNGNGHVSMAASVDAFVIVGSQGNLYALNIRTHPNGERIIKQNKSHKIDPTLFLENAYKPIETFPRLNPMVVIPSRKELDEIVALSDLSRVLTNRKMRS